MKRLLFVIGLLFTLAACSKTENLQSQKDADVSLIESRASTDNSPSLPDGGMTIYEKMDSLMMGLIPNLPVDPLFAGYVYVYPPDENIGGVGMCIKKNMKDTLSLDTYLNPKTYQLGLNPGSVAKINYDAGHPNMYIGDEYYAVERWDMWEFPLTDRTPIYVGAMFTDTNTIRHLVVTRQIVAYKPKLKKVPKPKCHITVITKYDSEGTVSGGGIFAMNETFTLKAIPKEGYKFDYWTRNGIKIDWMEATYTATVKDPDPVTFEAFFSPKTKASVGVECSDGGYVSGDQGIKYINDPFTISATPYDGYRFLYWKKNGQIIQDAGAIYTTSVADASPVTFYAQFESIAQTANVLFNNFIDNDYYDNRSYVVYQNPQGQEVTLTPDMISHEIEVKKGSSIVAHIYVSKPGEQIYCILKDSSNEIYYDLSRPDVISQQITIENVTDYTEITFQVDSSDFR